MKAKDGKKCLAILTAGLMVSVNASAYINHQVQRGETLWGLAHKYKVSADDIIKLNPSLKNGLKSGHTIRIPEPSDLPGTQENVTNSPATVNTDEERDPQLSEEENITDDTYEPAFSYEETATYRPNLAQQESKGTDTYVARHGETFKSVQAKTGVAATDLEVLNPLVDGDRIAEGEVIRLTAEAPYSTRQTNLTTVDSIVYRVVPTDSKSVSTGKEAVVAVMLPFELAQDEVSRQALLSTDFYKGFLIATKDHSRHIGYDLRLYAVDTSDDSTPIQNQLEMLADEGVKVIIPPDDERLIGEIERFSHENGITVLNVLNIKDEGYLTYPNVIQCNINQKLMYDKAIQALGTFYPNHIPVILDLAGGKEEKAGFTNELKKQYRERGINVQELTFSDELKESDLETLRSDKKYILIPKSGAQEVFDKISGAIEAKIESDPYPDRIKLFGYPDWVSFRGTSEEELHNVGAVIYSRFDYNPEASETSDLSGQFRRWYGAPQIEVFPSQGTLGYDAGMALLRMLESGWPDDTTVTHTGTYTGQQSSFRFVQQPDGGKINDALYIIEFMPGTGTYSKVI
ncbi:MAG: LysM peptidoglycan-binding domain-containing protein [Muribaculaceae bacterium]|nr:LysM peptidoglycan-binding domain-containing protein [Muribaculaceae bacterium]